MSPNERLSAIASHVPKPTPGMSSSSERPWITCHVLDTVSGKPAAGVSVQLTHNGLWNAHALRWKAETNSDGRVTAWQDLDGVALNQQVANIREYAAEKGEHDLQREWTLSFATEEYFGKGNTFWPTVDLKFSTKISEEHYHVPLLLGPWSYTTYRGS